MIEQIFIENYKSMRKAEIPLRNLNVLIGSNGAGKSNFISFFEMVQKMLYQQFVLLLWLLCYCNLIYPIPLL